MLRFKEYDSLVKVKVRGIKTFFKEILILITGIISHGMWEQDHMENFRVIAPVQTFFLFKIFGQTWSLLLYQNYYYYILFKLPTYVFNNTRNTFFFLFFVPQLKKTKTNKK